MTEIGETHHRNPKFGSGGNFGSDGDSGYDDPGVITIPVVRTVVHNDSNGRKVSSTSTDWISVKKNDSHEEAKKRDSVSECHSETPIWNKNVTEKSSPKFFVKENDHKDSRQQRSNIDYMTSHFNNLNEDDFRVTHFSKEANKDDESQRTYRFVSRMRGGYPRPIIRDVVTSHNVDLKETTIKKVPRRRIRSKSADSKRVVGPQNLFSATYSKVLSPETMRKRKLLADILKRKCIIEEEYYKLPYQEINREIALCLYSSSETRLNEIQSRPDYRDEHYGQLDIQPKDFSFKSKYESTGNSKVGFLRSQNNEMFGGDFGAKLQKLQTDSTKFPVPESPSLINARNALQELLNDIQSDDELDERITKNTENINLKKCFENRIGTINDTDKIITHGEGQTITFNEGKTITCNESKISPRDEGKSVAYDAGKTKTYDEGETNASQLLSDSEFVNIIKKQDDPKLSLRDSSKNNSSNNSNEKLGDEENISKEDFSFSNLKKDRKKKYKKSVSFSTENEEMYFTSSVSDSDSSVFEELNLDSPQENFNDNELNGRLTSFENDSGTESAAGKYDIYSPDSSMFIPKQSLINCKTDKRLNNNYKAAPTSIHPNTSDVRNDNARKNTKHISDNKNRINASREARNKARHNYLYGSQNYSPTTPNDNDNKHKINKDNYVFQKQATNNANFNKQSKFNYPSQPIRSPCKENERIKKSKKTKNYSDFKGNKVNIYMTNGASFTDHEIQFRTHTFTGRPNVTVTKFKVPFSSIRDQWEWAAPFMVTDGQEKCNSFHSFPIYSVHPKSLQIASPTPSCGSTSNYSDSSGCYSASCSPTPSPTRSKGTLVPTSL